MKKNTYYVTFLRHTQETVKVQANTAREARDTVYDSFGQAPQTCKSMNLEEVDFLITDVTKASL